MKLDNIIKNVHETSILLRMYTILLRMYNIIKNVHETRQYY